MYFQTLKTFIHLWNTNKDLFLLNLRAFFPSIDSYATTTLTLQKVHKEIVKLVNVHLTCENQ